MNSVLLSINDSGSPATLQNLQLGKDVSNIFAQISQAAVQGRNDSVSWRMHEDDSSLTKWTGPHLYDGSCGIALFLGAYHLVTRDQLARRFALQAISQLRSKLAGLSGKPGHLLPQNLAIGGFVGLGGFLYTFIQLSSWLNEPTLMQSAMQTVSLITTDRILNDSVLDVVGGCAGTLLALLKLASIEDQVSSQAVDLALCCGKRLLERRIVHNGSRAWPGSTSAPLCGFAHGASGIAYALVQLFKHTGRQEFLEAAFEGFDFERKLYDPAARAWLDLRFNRPHEQNAWCHGAPGIVLARLGATAVISDSMLQRDLENALAITINLPEVTRDHLCCGNFGLVEILQTAGWATGDTNLRALANILVERTLNRAHKKGFSFFGISAHEDCELQQPSLFRGVSGAGYTLMRQVYPDMLPCILTLA